MDRPHLRSCAVAFLVLTMHVECREQSRQASSDERQEARNAEGLRNAETLKALAARTGATSRWDQGLEEDDEPGLSLVWHLTSHLFAIEVQDALVRPEPIAFIATLVDVRRDPNGVVLEFAHPPIPFTAVYFDLRGTEEQLRYVINGERRPTLSLGPQYAVVVDAPQYAVVAQVRTVTRIRREIVLEAEEIEMNFDYRPLVATGDCVEIVYLPPSGD